MRSWPTWLLPLANRRKVNVISLACRINLYWNISIAMYQAGGNVVGVSGKGRRNIASRVKDIVQALALCHNVSRNYQWARTIIKPGTWFGQVTPVISVDEDITYQASSPDEVAIVKWTEQMGLTLVARDVNSIQLRVNTTSELLDYDVLHIFPFTSETKRMGIIIRDRQTNEITFYEKGADVVMSTIVQYNDW